MGDMDEDEYRDTKEHYTGDVTRQAMETLIYYCKRTECKKCRYFYNSYECGLHNPSAWKGENKNKELKRMVDDMLE